MELAVMSDIEISIWVVTAGARKERHLADAGVLKLIDGYDENTDNKTDEYKAILSQYGANARYILMEDRCSNVRSWRSAFRNADATHEYIYIEDGETKGGGQEEHFKALRDFVSGDIDAPKSLERC